VLELTTVVLTMAVLLLVISTLQPVADRWKVPVSVLLAVVGVAIGAVASFLLFTPLTDRFNEIVAPIVHLPVSSATFIYVFLPLLLFQASLTIDVPRLIEDLAPVLLLAVVAVIVTTAVVGIGMAWLFGLPLLACLLLGSIIATTDPAAVVAIFREIGAPARLTRLVEAESLLNDAAAIALFGLLLALLLRGEGLNVAEASFRFLVLFVGGAALGMASGWLLMTAVPWLANLKAAEATLTLAAPYAVFIVGDQFLQVSGVVAVVSLGLWVSAFGKSTFLSENWQHLHNLWEQVAFWAGSLVFILGAILAPRLLADVRPIDALMVGALAVAALLARAFVLFLLLPGLSVAKLTKPVSHRYKLAILWGGLRGAVTLALALAVVENRELPAEIKRFIAVIGTGYVLFNLLVNGLSLRPMIRALKLNRLSPREQRLRDQIVALSLTDVRDAIREASFQHQIAPQVADPVLQHYEGRIRAASAARRPDDQEVTDRQQLTVALVALAQREHDLLREHLAQQTASRSVLDALLRQAERLIEAARGEGRSGYMRAVREGLIYPRRLRLAHFLHRHFAIEGFLARQLAARFEAVLIGRLVLNELRPFVEKRLSPVFGARIAGIVAEMLQLRAEANAKALDSVRLQYPDYAEQLERRYLRRFALRREMAEYEALRMEGLLTSDLFEHLRREGWNLENAEDSMPKLDLGLSVRELVTRIDFFRGLSNEEVDAICKLFRPRLALPGEVIARKGEPGDAVFLISSGAVEVRLPHHVVRLGRGEFFGELAMILRRRRNADVVALSYCQLLVLDAADFRTFLNLNPLIRAHIDRIVASRLGEASPLASPELFAAPD
jgi:CPA1 family monovalent cation:H+ antiporter